MLFIKNLTKLDGVDFRIDLTEDDGISIIALKIADEKPVNILTSGVEGVYNSLKKSFDYVNEIINVTAEEPVNSINCCLLSNKPTEINFVVKDTKIVIKDSEFFPVVVDKYEEADLESNKHYPRDMVLFIVPNGEKEDYTLVVDRRNLGAPIISKEVGDYRIIGLFVKWPIWMKLKFPAYAYIKNKNNEDDVIGAIKLGFKTDKKITRNQVQDVDVNEVVEYLTESFRLLRESHEQAANKTPEKSNKDRRPNNGYDKGVKKGNFNKNHNTKPNDRNHGRVGFPSKFANNKGGNNHKSQNNKRKSFHK